MEVNKKAIESVVSKCFLIAEQQHENWSDEDTIRLIVDALHDTLLKNSSKEY